MTNPVGGAQAYNVLFFAKRQQKIVREIGWEQSLGPEVLPMQPHVAVIVRQVRGIQLKGATEEAGRDLANPARLAVRRRGVIQVHNREVQNVPETRN